MTAMAMMMMQMMINDNDDWPEVSPPQNRQHWRTTDVCFFDYDDVASMDDANDNDDDDDDDDILSS